MNTTPCDICGGRGVWISKEGAEIPCDWHATPWTEEQQWANVNRVMELVKQEGDANCERAFDFLMATLAVVPARLADLRVDLELAQRTARENQEAWERREWEATQYLDDVKHVKARLATLTEALPLLVAEFEMTPRITGSERAVLKAAAAAVRAALAGAPPETRVDRAEEGVDSQGGRR